MVSFAVVDANLTERELSPYDIQRTEPPHPPHACYYPHSNVSILRSMKW